MRDDLCIGDITGCTGPSGFRSLLDSLAFHVSFFLVVASPWILACSGLFEFIDALCNWRDCGFENLPYWLGYRV